MASIDRPLQRNLVEKACIYNGRALKAHVAFRIHKLACSCKIS